MDKLTIYLDDGTYDGTVILGSVSSHVKAIRVKREENIKLKNLLI